LLPANTSHMIESIGVLARVSCTGMLPVTNARNGIGASPGSVTTDHPTRAYRPCGAYLVEGAPMFPFFPEKLDALVMGIVMNEFLST